MGVNMIVYQVVNEYKRFEEVLSITLSGSGASSKNDFFFDIDISILVNKDMEIIKRNNILKKFSDTIETVKGINGDQDIFILRNSTTQINITYYTLKYLEESLCRVVERCEADLGYTTCIWKEVISSFIAYDKNNTFKMLQERYKVSYPEKLKISIINKNYYVLKNNISSYYNQIDKAIDRNDVISINKNICKFLDSYFECIFALNEMPHPGEKRILPIINAKCKKRPELLSEEVTKLIKSTAVCDKGILRNMDNMIEQIKALLCYEGIKVS